MQLKTTEGIAAEFAKRNAKKAAATPVIEEREFCIGKCGRRFRPTEPTCWKDREGPYCYECWEGS